MSGSHRDAAPGLFARLGLAIAAPRRALALAGERRHAGRAGSDLLAAIAILLAATQLRWIVQAVWIGGVVDAALGLRALVHVLVGTLSIDLGFLVIAAAVVAVAGRARDLGGAFDLACVAALPLVLVDLAAGVATEVVHAAPSDELRWGVTVIAFGWAGALVALAIGVARGPRPAGRPARGLGFGWLVVAFAAAGVALQVRWLVGHADLLRPLEAGAPAPALALPRIGPGGALGEPVSLPPGKIAVVDFWATWCGPCLRAMPALDRFARAHPEVTVLAVNLDDPAEARAIFDRQHYALALLADDGAASERWGVTAIPHTALIRADGTLARVNHGDVGDLEAKVARLEGRSPDPRR